MPTSADADSQEITVRATEDRTKTGFRDRDVFLATGNETKQMFLFKLTALFMQFNTLQYTHKATQCNAKQPQKGTRAQ